MAIVRSPTQRAWSVARYAGLGVASALFLIPFYLLVRNAFMSDTDLTAPDWYWLPPHWQWSNVTGVFDDPAVPMARALANSVAISVVQTIGVLVLSGLAGYGLARIPYRWSNAVFYTITATLLIPAAVTFVPSFVLVSTLGWISTLRGLIIPGLFQALATFLFRQFFLSFPKEIEEAAFLDGLGYWGTFWRIVVPNSGGFVAAIGTITFIGSWNAFLWPLVIGRDPSSWTVQIALSTYLTAQRVDLAQLFMAALIAILPLLLMFLFLQRWIVEGVERTGIAGD
ncbi:Binding-protein-dependent transport systems inner membrane component [Nostocoides japonicum T1-X7]|uniref:Binding-protein-dependent transport systems inner membrane component n=1 Tax=Nostocoides japonicum T1-X7 TaxID=1194083 RepID=A0A077LXL1_9MICO|nr:carbohydrate ABC transporter permease [Tetrasphaera japonica]CCH77647.1 Binding-protein-dependent transport systems inner membrane component [Tetrasphaera japonica T1-X7]